MTTAAHTRPGVGHRTAAGDRGEAVAALAFGALCAFSLLTWSRLVAPGWTAGALATAACATAVAQGALTPARGGAVRRALPACALIVAGLVIAGVPARILVPDRWDRLASGVADGIGTLSSLTVPYAGQDAWARRTLLLTGIAFVVVAALAAARGRERGEGGRVPAAIALVALYAVAIIQLEPARPALSGADCALLLAAMLWADRIPAGLGATAAVLVTGAVAAGMLAVPLLDRARPAIDWQRLTTDATAGRTATYRWDHDYGALHWPRRGREVLRISTTRPSYWKAAVLDRFDGRAWRQAGGVASFEPASDRRLLSSGWTRRISVTVRDLATAQFVGAGETLAITRAAVGAIGQAGGFFVSGGRDLRRGDTYTATVYTPRPSTRQLERAGQDYPSFARLWLRVELPGVPVRRVDPNIPVEAQFAPFGRHDATLISGGGAGLISVADPDAIVRGSSLGRLLALAERLRRRARTPYEFVRAVQARVRRGATYDERPPESSAPLQTFLFTEARGYCQHFSGAMALLLRMGGVPARVATGFAPGTYERAQRRYSVSDLDAHSWVEAYFPRIGWVTFDPTPAASPARSQTADLASGGRVRPSGLVRGGGDSPADTRGGGGARAGDGGGGLPAAPLAAGLVLLAAAALSLTSRRRRRRGPAPAPSAPELAELERALRRTGRAPAPGATLTALRGTLGPCGGYLDALIRRRFGSGGPPPTAGQRRALRRALGEGLGARGTLRAWWALPPRLFGGGPGGR